MNVRIHSHHAEVSPRLQRRAEEGIVKLSRRARNLVRASVRFEEDGPTRRVGVALHSPGERPLIGEANARTFGPALSRALERVTAQLHHGRRVSRPRARGAARA